MIKIWAISDLHLSISVSSKNMGHKFPLWESYQEKIKLNWNQRVNQGDIVLIPGDICWALKIEDAKQDLAFIDKLNGHKIISPGNHDFWWRSNNALSKINLKTITFIKWGSLKLENGLCIVATKFTNALELLPLSIRDLHRQDLYDREMFRLKSALNISNTFKGIKMKIAMMHYPVVKNNIINTEAHFLLKENNISICIFGHIHDKDAVDFDNIENRGVKYMLVAADYLKFCPTLVCEI